jgi:uncharacterized membrane protein YdjX (TVP38/TMEM64 family)
MKIRKYINIKLLISLVILATLSVASIFITFYFPDITSKIFKIALVSLLALFCLGYILSYIYKKEKTYKLLIIANYFAVTSSLVYLTLEHYNLLFLFGSVEDIREFILSTGSMGQFIFVFIQFVQVSILPIPAIVTTLAGVAIYGPLTASILTSIAVIAGSLFSFFVWGRLFGYKMVVWIAGKKTTDKYRAILSKKGKYLLVVMFILPFFPDDILCMVAGITAMSGVYFTVITFLVRPISIFVICYFGGGQIIPYSDWGLIVWPIILIIMAVLVFFTFKYHDKIDDFVKEKLHLKS